MPPKARSSSRPSREQRRSQLLDAAVAAIRATGAGASMEQLAAAGGVTKPILYRHFGDRHGLVDAIGERFGTLLLDRVGATLEADSPEDLLHRTVDGYLEFLEEDPELYSFLVRQTSPADQSVTALIDVIGRQVAVVIGDRMRALRVDAGGAEPMAFGIVGMVHSAGDWWIRTRTMSRQALTTYLVDLLWHGFSGIAAGAPPGEGTGSGASVH